MLTLKFGLRRTILEGQGGVGLIDVLFGSRTMRVAFGLYCFGLFFVVLCSHIKGFGVHDFKLFLQA